MDDLKIFVAFTKKDEDQRLVSGYASSEALDSQGEIVEIEAIAKALPGYLGDVDPTTGKFRYGNIREMHQLSAVGKTIYASIDKKGLYIEGKVVDDNAWKKVKEGVYAGFSIGGKVLSSVKNRIKALKLSEISLVDRPANPEAVFSMVKFDEKGKAMNDKAASPKPEDYSVMDAGHLLDLARDIRMMLNMFQAEGRSTIELSNALTSLKKLAAKILMGDDKKKFEDILYGYDPEEMQKLTMIPKAGKIEEKTPDIKKYVDNNWKDGYFQDLKKVLG